MWKLNNSNLERTKTGSFPISLLRTTASTRGGVISRVKLYDDEEVEGLAATIPTITSGVYVLDLSAEEDLEQIDKIQIGQSTFTLGDSEDDLKSGEFFFDPDTKQLTIKPGNRVIFPVTEGQPISIKKKKIKTSKVKVELPPFFYKLPILGQFSWSRSFEQHPNAQFNMIVGINNIDEVRRLFKVGTEYTIFDIGFIVNSVSEEELSVEEFPGGVFRVGVSFEGKWSYFENKQVWLKGKPKSLNAKKEPYQDEDCKLTVPQLLDNPKFRTTLQELAEQIDAKVVGVNAFIPVPRNTPKDALTTIGSEISKLKRVQGSFVYYSDGEAIKLKEFGNTALHDIYPSDIQSISNTYQGTIAKVVKHPQISLKDFDEINYEGSLAAVTTPSLPKKKKESYNHLSAPEYPNVVLDGLFVELEDLKNSENRPDLGRPRYRRIPPKIEVLSEGDVDWDLPPENSRYPFKTLDNNADYSGITKTIKTTRTEDGFPIYDETSTYGWIYTGEDSAEVGGEVRWNAPSWIRVKYELTTYQYSSEGYLLAIISTGWDLRRFRPETEELETLTYTAPGDAPYKNLYVPFKMPLQTVTRYLLEPYSLYYQVNYTDAYDEYKICNRDGTSSVRYAPKPDYAVPYFIRAEQKQIASFAYTRDPDSTSDDPRPLITTGEESFFQRLVEIKKGRNIKVYKTIIKENGELVHLPVEENDDDDRYTEFVSQQSAQDGSFRNGAKTVTFREYAGRPPVATRKPKNFERVDPNGDKNIKKDKYRYQLTTEGYTTEDPINSTISYEYAYTKETAVKAAKTDLYIRDMQETVDTRVVIDFNDKIREGDRIRLISNFYTYRRIVKSVSHTIEWQGLDDNGDPFIVKNSTSLNLGIDREIEITEHKVKRPKDPNTNRPTPQPPNRPPGGIIRKAAIGALIDSSFETRRNF